MNYEPNGKLKFHKFSQKKSREKKQKLNNHYLTAFMSGIGIVFVFIAFTFGQSEEVGTIAITKPDYQGIQFTGVIESREEPVKLIGITESEDNKLIPSTNPKPTNVAVKRNSSSPKADKPTKEENGDTEEGIKQEIQSTNKVVVYVKGFPEDSLATKIATYGYKLGGLSFITMLKCENGGFGIATRGDSGKAVGLCQMNELYHDLPDEYYTNRQTQVELCYKKYKEGTPFYGPSRILANGQRCSNAMKSEFIINNID